MRYDKTQLNIAREGVKVAFASGIWGDPRTATAALLTLPEPPLAAAPPLGPVILRPRSMPPPKLPGVVRGWEYFDPWLGLVGFIPPGLTATTSRKDIELVVKRVGTSATGILLLSDRVTVPKFNLQVMDTVAAGFASGAGVQPMLIRGGEVTLPLGPAVVRHWAVPGTTLEMQILLVPICNGTGSFVFVQIWANGAEKAELDQWLTSFRPLPGVNPPVCRKLIGE